MRIRMKEPRVWKKAGSGSTLGWVILVIMVMMILIMSALTMSASHMYRYQRYHNRKQINMTAISVAKAIAADLESGSGTNGFGDILERMLEESEEGETPLNGLAQQMGDVCLQYHYEEGSLALTVLVRVGKETGQTTLVMRKEGSGEKGETWVLAGYGTEEPGLELEVELELEWEEDEREEDGAGGGAPWQRRLLEEYTNAVVLHWWRLWFPADFLSC